jgi:hypothetical protein
MNEKDYSLLDIALCSLAETYQRFIGAYYLHLQAENQILREKSVTNIFLHLILILATFLLVLSRFCLVRPVPISLKDFSRASYSLP